MTMDLSPFLTPAPFGLETEAKITHLLPRLNALTEHHRAACAPYRKMIDLAFPPVPVHHLAELPFLPISLFKYRTLRSIAHGDIKVTIRSSGTSGSARSAVDLDAPTARMAAVTLSSILASVMGGERLPMLIIDTQEALKGAEGMGARAAAILGLMPFGRDHTFALRADMSLDENALKSFLSKYPQQPVLIYGFTFLVWQHLAPACAQLGLDLSRAMLLHSGGWKKLFEQSVSNRNFKDHFKKTVGLEKIVNFYGMAETPGLIFPENEEGFMAVPNFAHVIIRDPSTFRPVTDGTPGLIQILSALPESYPGHSLLTEDIGLVEPDAIGTGQFIRILGRAPKAELRGCSDVLAIS